MSNPPCHQAWQSSLSPWMIEAVGWSGIEVAGGIEEHAAGRPGRGRNCYRFAGGQSLLPSSMMGIGIGGS